MHNEITENTWKAEEKRHKLKPSRKHVINTSRRYLGKNWIATQGGPPYPHNERGQSMFFGFIAVSRAIEKNLLTFSTETKHEWSFTSGKVQFLHHSSVKKWLQKLIETHVREHLTLSSPERTVSLTTPAEKKAIPSIFLHNIRSRKQSQKAWWSQWVKVNCHYTPKSVDKTNSLKHQVSKTFENNISRRVDGVGKFTVKSIRTQKKGSEAKKMRYTVHGE